MRRMPKCIHESLEWPKFRWDQTALTEKLAAVRHRQGRLIGRMEGLGFPLRSEAVLQTLTQDVLKSSEIGGLTPADGHVEGIVEMMLDATQKYKEPLTDERLFAWHAAMFPTGRSGMRKITVGAWRDDKSGPMQVVSGPVGHERGHHQ